uniref:RNase_Zc3h12a_2 domain-containing protein n=1 Tax=Caenorhabditis tropicalis TaxID=1561998 RepID=A0A1I7U345_9PELO
MVRKCMCRIAEDQSLRLFSRNDLSLIWNTSIEIENSSILSQREAEWRLRPVFIDGLSLLDQGFPTKPTTTKIITKILLEVIAHFVLDGHETILYLPNLYSCDIEENVDDPIVFEFLCKTNLLSFVNETNKKKWRKKS